MELREALTNLRPGDKFIYNSKSYVLTNITPADLRFYGLATDVLCAVDLETYKVMCFYKDWEVIKV